MDDKDGLINKLCEIPFLRDACRKTYEEFHEVDGSIGGVVVDSLLIEGARLVVDKLARAFESLDKQGWGLISERLSGSNEAREILLELLELGPGPESRFSDERAVEEWPQGRVVTNLADARIAISYFLRDKSMGASTLEISRSLGILGFDTIAYMRALAVEGLVHSVMVGDGGRMWKLTKYMLPGKES